jgi:2-hydroxychromene-2-carboxylate isomerase
MRQVEFLFDFISPYAYLAWQRVHEVAARWDAEVVPTPILFAALLDANGHKGPAEIPSKREYVFKNVLRIAHDLGVPLVPPPSHPFNPLPALRLVTAQSDPGRRKALVSALFDATWGGGDGVGDLAAIERAIARAGLASDTIDLSRANDEVTKAALKSATDQALAAGVFGVPTMKVGDELFWGFDSLPHLEQYLAGRDPIASRDLTRWRELPATARRRGG